IRFFLFRKDDPGMLIGMINFTQIFRGGFQACYLGYKIDKDFEGKGYMTKALKKSLSHIFEIEKIHRIMSNFMPHNLRSAKVLLRLGFVIEGYAKNYLKINEKWQDHILTALSYEKWTSKEPPDAKKAFDETLENLRKWGKNL
ncbi:MAG: GNAT family N-acetyltransferase, partial [Parachlamydiaceae bacterium]